MGSYSLLAGLALLAGCTTQNPKIDLSADLGASAADLRGASIDLGRAAIDLRNDPDLAPAAADLAAGDLAPISQADLAPLAPDLAACVKETDQAFCTRLGRNCGEVISFDNCGASRSTVCGGCNLPESCGAVTANLCGCVNESDAAFCARLGQSCGVVSDFDNCGASRTASCGPSCPCVPQSDDALCAMYNLQCVPAETTDNCGNQRDLSCRNGCSAGICPGLSDGSNCATTQLGGDWMNNCQNHRCVPALGFCQFDNGSATWGFQKPGEGGAGANSCACTTPFHLALRFNDIPAANVDLDCAECVQLSGRVVCF